MLVHYALILSLSASLGLSHFDPREATVESVHDALHSVTCREVVTTFLSRIEALNHHINAIISLNPDVLDDADQLDARYERGNTSGALFCIPILLKDNFDLANMPTTGGSYALRSLQPTVDAPSVAALKRAGAIVLGKTNLHELALEGLTVSSCGGQTVNPYDSSRTPGGSSGGSAAAVAASFSVFATGTDTVNSLRSPASANSLFSIRPTRGLIKRIGVMPVSHTQDALGIIARTVKDIAAGLTAMIDAGPDDEDDLDTHDSEFVRGLDYLHSLTFRQPERLRLGLVTTFLNHTAHSEIDPVNQAMDSFVRRLKGAGVSVINVTNSIYDSRSILARYDTQKFEFREMIDDYLSKKSGDHPRSLESLYMSQPDERNGDFLVIPAQYMHIKETLVSSTSNSTYLEVQSGIRDLRETLRATLADGKFDALIYPQQENLVVQVGSANQFGRNGILAAVTGSPVVTIPIGYSLPSETAPYGIPIGMEILGRPWDEQILLDIAWTFESLEKVRRPPRWAEEAVEARKMLSVPNILPIRGNIPPQYPLGKI